VNRLALIPSFMVGMILAPALVVAAPGSGVAGPLPAMQVAERASIEGPWTVDPGQKVTVTISGGVSGGQLQIWGPVTQSSSGRVLAAGESSGGSVPVTAPSAPGSYELRYVNQAGAVLARRTFEVASFPIRLSIPDQPGTGLPVDVRWHGPARPGDVIQIVDPARGVVVSEGPAEGQPGAQNVTRLRMPQQPGEYQLRYVDGARGGVLRTLPISVGPPRTWLRSPTQVNVRESFRVEWNGPVEPDQMFQLVDPTGSAVISARPGTAGEEQAFATFTAPSKPGRYRVRYVNTATGQMHSDLPLVVTGR
jgi:Ca-activated chloride channel family protein